jgi:hypothetical protein
MRYSIIVLISCIISQSLAFSGNLPVKPTNLKNDSSFKMELLKLEYGFFIADSDAHKYEALIQKVKLSLQNKAFSKAIYDIKRIELLERNVLLQNHFYTTMEELLFFHELYNACLDMINTDTLEKYTIEKSFMKTLCLNEEGKYELILEELKHASVIFKIDTNVTFNELKSYEVNNSEKQSLIYQALLPGAGMAKEDAVKEGITSFMLNGIFIATPILLIKQKLFLSAFSYGIMPLSKFYLGGIRHTRYLASKNEEKRIEEIKQLNAEILLKFYHQ